MRLSVITSCLICLCAGVTFAVRSGSTPKVQETEIDHVSGAVEFPTVEILGYRTPDFAFAPDLSRVAYIARDKKGDFLASGSRRSDSFPTVEDAQFSPNGNVLIAFCKQGEQIAYIVNFQTGAFFENDLSADSAIVHFSPDGRSITYKMTKGTQAAPAVNDKPLAWYDDVRRPTFNPVTGQPAYLAQSGGKWFFVDGANKTALTYTPELLAFDNGHHVIFGNTGGKKVVDTGGLVSRRYDEITAHAFSPLGGALAYVGRRGDQDYVVFRQIEHGPYDNVFFLRFSPEGGALAYTAMRQGKSVVVLGTHEYPVDGVASAVTVSPDGQHVAYQATVGGKIKLYVNDHPVAEYSPDGPAPMDRYDIAFNGNGHAIAFPLIGEDKEWAAIVDVDNNATLLSPAYDRVREVHFNPGSQSLVFGAVKNKKFLKVNMEIK